MAQFSATRIRAARPPENAKRLPKEPFQATPHEAESRGSVLSQVVAQTFLELGTAKLADGRRLDLADALARKTERMADFLKRVVLVRPDAVAQAKHLSLTGSEIVKRLLDAFDHRTVLEGTARIVMFIAAHEVELRRILVITDWCVDGLDAAHSLREKLHLGERKLGKIGKLLLGRLPAVLLQEVLLVTADLVVGLRHVDRNADGVAEVGHGKTFTIIAEGLSKEHKYIDSITLNGEPYTKNYISHEDILKGGTLVYKMK